MKYTFTRLKLVVILVIVSCACFAQTNVWTDVSEASMGLKRDSRIGLPKQFRTLRLDTTSLLSALLAAPKEFTNAAKNSPLVLAFPMPDGSFKRFKVNETSVMEPGLASKFPNIKTYGGQGIEEPSATIKIDWTALGLHAMIISEINGSVFIDPYGNSSLVNYISYNKKDITRETPFIENDPILNKATLKKFSSEQRASELSCIGGVLKRYRLAVACTAEYAQAAVGTKSVTPEQALSAIVTTVNRVDGVYETELDIRMVLVSNNNKIVFTNTATQPFKGNNNVAVLILESQAVIDSLIGNANYDIGHTFSSNSTLSSGYAGIGVVCNNAVKAKGVTGTPTPVGDPYSIDYVAHEMGHQFGATHTFNATTGACGDYGQLDPTTNAEPGSGVTIMAYAGICGSENNLQAHSIPYFHAVSTDQITDYINNGVGSSCSVPISTGNTPPVVNAGSDYIIPKSTPFVLTGSATDADNDALTYSWEEINAGGTFGNWNQPYGDAPIFRSFAPVTTPFRYFPKISDIVNNTTTIGEILPSYSRALQFRLTARDNRAGGAGVCSDEASVRVAAEAGPFIVTAPDTATTWEVGSFSTITWNVANTNTAPVNCTSVVIELSTDGGLTFPFTLVANTPNDGIEEIIVPGNITASARVRVRAAGNIFFDMSNANFTIKASSEAGFTFSNPQPVISCKSSFAGTTIKTNPLNGFSTPVTLSASGNPAGTSVVFSANPINPGSSDSITITGNIPAGIYNITITGIAGAVVKTRVIRFTIGLPTTAPVNGSPANNSIGHPLLPAFKWNSTANTQYYTLNISTSPAFTTSVQSIDNIADTLYTLTTPLEPNTQYYWRIVPHNSCGAGPASAGSLFKTVAIVCAEPFYSNNVPRIIDTITNTITSTLNIINGGIIQDIDVVGLKGKHVAAEEITISLTSPSGKSIVLYDNVCYGSQTFNLHFDDDAAQYLSCPLDSQTAKPSNALSFLQNENSNGTWKLQVDDPYNGAGGSLDSWGLRICTYQPAALPVNWLAFTANTTENKTVLLQWSTASEINNYYYEIEKSIDGITYSSIGRINAANSSAGLQQYAFNDLKPSAGNNYYRLKQVDKDGNYSYSKIAKVNINENADRYLIYPNPAVNKSTIRILNDVKQLTISLTDASGKQVYQRRAGAAKTGQEFEIPVKAFSKGLYILTLVTDSGILNEKIIIQ